VEVNERIYFHGATGRWQANFLPESLLAKINAYARDNPSPSRITEHGVAMLIIDQFSRDRENDAKIRNAMFKAAEVNQLRIEHFHVVTLKVSGKLRINRREIEEQERDSRALLVQQVANVGPDNVYFPEPERYQILPALVREGPATVLLKLHGYAMVRLVDVGLYREERLSWK
jgi:hypothetical protein